VTENAPRVIEDRDDQRHACMSCCRMQDINVSRVHQAPDL